jgi:hypothetical protein
MTMTGLEILLPVVSTFLFYLGGHAAITQWLWSRYPAWLEAWAMCPACAATWYGVALGWVSGRWLDLSLFGLPPHHWGTLLVAGAWCAFWTPLLAWCHLRALGAVLGPWALPKALVEGEVERRLEERVKAKTSDLERLIKTLEAQRTTPSLSVVPRDPEPPHAA